MPQYCPITFGFSPLPFYLLFLFS
uniref:Uncharacterized protein n=1 Tax=Anguilla anguilla TaxID=7936 RepID=A0A0E9PC98_ANGAN